MSITPDQSSDQIDAETAHVSDSVDGDTQAAGPPDTPRENVLDGSLRGVHPSFQRTEFISWLIFDTGVLVAPTIAGPIIVLNVSMHWLGSAGIIVGVLLLWTGLAIASWMHPPRRFRSVKYAVSEQGIEIHHGIYWRHVVNVPRSRIQHTDVVQGPIMRRYGLATLQVHTAGVEYNKVELPGLAHSVAMTLRDDLAGHKETYAV